MYIIYKIVFENIPEIYIGSTNNLSRRISQHLYNSKNVKWSHRQLYKYMNSYKYKYEIIESQDCSKSVALAKEQECINLYKPCLNKISAVYNRDHYLQIRRERYHKRKHLFK